MNEQDKLTPEETARYLELSKQARARLQRMLWPDVIVAAIAFFVLAQFIDGRIALVVGLLGLFVIRKIQSSNSRLDVLRRAILGDLPSDR